MRIIRNLDDATEEIDVLSRHNARVVEARTDAYLRQENRLQKRCICRCGSPLMRDGANVVWLKRPEHMPSTKRGPVIDVDLCVAPVVEYLWSLGVVTGGACCGHGEQVPTVAVMDESIGLMLRLGYTQTLGSEHIFDVEQRRQEI